MREFFLLQRGEQRAMIMISVLLILILGLRMLVGALPAEAGGDMEAFEREARLVMAEFRQMDSIKAMEDSLTAVRHTEYRSSTYRRSYSAEPSASSIPLNTIDSAGLLPLPGIGPVYAGRIVRYRALLGGYVHLDQLLEVYGMDSLRYLPLLSFLSIDSSRIRKLNLNQASFRELLRHPYLEYEDVKALVQYRDRVGTIISKEEIATNSVLSDSVIDKVEVYLKTR